MVGIIVAVNEELEAILSKMNNITTDEKYGNKFYVGDITPKEKCVLVLCGVGKVNAARTTQLLIDNYSPDYIMNSGVAGGISDKIKIGDIVIGKKLVQHDVDITAFGREKGELADGLGKYMASDENLVKKAYEILSNASSTNGVLGTIASGDQFVTSKRFSIDINKEFGADCVEMEGAAIAQVCKIDNVPFICFRSISDSPNDNNKVDYESFVKLASENVANFTKMFLS